MTAAALTGAHTNIVGATQPTGYGGDRQNTCTVYLPVPLRSQRSRSGVLASIGAGEASLRGVMKQKITRLLSIFSHS